MSTRKKLNLYFALACLVIVFCFIFALVNANAANTVDTRIFVWDAGENWDIVAPEFYKMYWSEAETSTYTLLTTFPAAESYTSPVEVTLTGKPLTWTTRYFVLVACGNLANEDGSITEQCSAVSNVVAEDFWIPFQGYGKPINFRREASAN